jgi:hypothetical protein
MLYNSGSLGQLYEMQDPQVRRQLRQKPCINEKNIYIIFLALRFLISNYIKLGLLNLLEKTNHWLMQSIYTYYIRSYMYQRSTAIIREEHLKLNIVEKLLKPLFM